MSPSNAGAGAGVDGDIPKPLGARSCGGYDGGGIFGVPDIESLFGSDLGAISAAAVSRAMGDGCGSAGCEARSLRRRSSDSCCNSDIRLVELLAY